MPIPLQTLRRWLRLFLLTVLVMVTAESVSAQTTGEGARPDVAHWDEVLTRAETYVRVRSPSEFGLSFHRKQLDQVREEASRIRNAAQQRLVKLEQVIVVLGPAPEQGSAGEPDETAARRQAYENDLAAERVTLAGAELALARVEALESDLAAAARRSLLDGVLQRLPIPVSPEVVWAAIQESVANIQALMTSFQVWYGDTVEGGKGRDGLWWRFLIIFATAVALGWFARKAVLQRFGRDPSVDEPSYARAVVAAVTDAVARGLIPGLIIAGLLAFFSRPGALVTGPPERMIEVLLAVILVFVLVVAVTRAVLAPELPQWRTIEIAPHNAHRITRVIVFMAAVYAVDFWFRLTAEDFTVSRDLMTVGLAMMVVLQAGAMFVLSHRTLWMTPEPAETETPEEPEPEKTSDGRFWRYVRGIIGLGAVFSILAALAGYGFLGRFLVDRIVATLIIIALVFLARGMLREVVGALTRSQLLRSRLGVQIESLRKIRFWVRGALDPILVVVGGLIVLPVWGVPREEISRWSLAVLQGFTVGNVTIAPLDIILAVAVFVATMAATRFVQRRLLERVLPETNISVSVQHSLTAGIGYFGVILAAALAIAVVGVDLTNIALVAGALSVGIGFGLQNVVNNFVSGVILLAERPIKVGDWVVVGDKEGFVKRINFRGTELETFHRASVIIPNAEILSTPLTNWTHKDRYGRIDIAIGVAYGSDTARVRDLLLEVAQSHNQVLVEPAPFVIFTNFGASSLDFELRCFTGDVIYRARIASDLRFEIDRRFREEAIEIPFPQRVLHMASATEPSTEALAEQTTTGPMDRPRHDRSGVGGEGDGDE